jgi:hypothetical protein
MANELAPIDLPLPPLGRGGGYNPDVGRAPSMSAPQMNNFAAQGMENFSKSMAAVEAIHKQTYDKQRSINDAVFNDAYALEFGVQSTAISQQMLNSPDAASPDFVAKLDSELAKKQEEVRKMISEQSGYQLSPEGRLRNHHMSFNVRRVIAEQAATQTIVQQRALALGSANQQIERAIREAAAADDPERAIQETDQIMQQMVKPIMPPSQYAELERTKRGEAMTEVMRERTKRGDVWGARGMVDETMAYPQNPTEAYVASALGARGIPAAAVMGTFRSEGAWERIEAAKTTGELGQYIELPEGTPPDLPLTQADKMRAVIDHTSSLHASLKEQLGRNPNAAEFKLAWLGLGGVLTVNPNTPVTDLEQKGIIPRGSVGMFPEVLSRSDGLIGRPSTAKEVIDWAYANQVRSGGMDIRNYIPTEQRRALMTEIETQIHKQEELAEKQREKVRKLTADEMMKNFEIANVQNDRDTMMKIAKDYRSVLSHEQFKIVNAAIHGDPVTHEDVPYRYELQQMARQASMEADVFERDYVNPALAAKRINHGTALALSNTIRDQLKSKGFNEPVVDVRKILSDSIEASTSIIKIQGFTDPIARENARIMSEFERFARANKDAPYEVLLVEADRLYQQHSYSKDSNRARIIGPSPYFDKAYQGDLSKLTVDEVDRASNKLEEDIRRKRIDERMGEAERLRLQKHYQLLMAPKASLLPAANDTTKKPTATTTKPATPPAVPIDRLQRQLNPNAPGAPLR